MILVIRILIFFAVAYAVTAAVLPGLAKDIPAGPCCSASICATEHHHEAEPIEPPKPPAKREFHIDTGWLSRAHIAAVSFDGVSTELWKRRCPECIEADPVARVFVGSRANGWRMGLFGSVEVIGVAAIPNKKVRRIVQVGLIAVHVWAGSRNVAVWR